MTLFGIPNCNTVKKAKDWLIENSIEFEFHDFKKKGITEEKLNAWCDKFGWESILNKKGLTWKKLDKQDQVKIDNQGSAIAYLLENTSAIKRPVVEKENEAVLLGFDPDQYKKLFRNSFVLI